VDEPLIKAEDPTAAEPSTAEGEAAPAESRSRWFLALKLSALAAVVGLLGLLVWATLAAGRGSSLVARIAAGKKPAAPGGQRRPDEQPEQPGDGDERAQLEREKPARPRLALIRIADGHRSVRLLLRSV